MTEVKALAERAEALLDRLYKSSGKAEAYGQPKAAALFAEAAKIITQLLADRATRDAQAKAVGRREALEEAAKVADDHMTALNQTATEMSPQQHSDLSLFGWRIAAAIRALRTEEEA